MVHTENGMNFYEEVLAFIFTRRYNLHPLKGKEIERYGRNEEHS